jgi:hypothetical protein
VVHALDDGIGIRPAGPLADPLAQLAGLVAGGGALILSGAGLSTE